MSVPQSRCPVAVVPPARSKRAGVVLDAQPHRSAVPSTAGAEQGAALVPPELTDV